MLQIAFVGQLLLEFAHVVDTSRALTATDIKLNWITIDINSDTTVTYSEYFKEDVVI